MNKSFLKFIPASLAVIALASCNADDLWESSVNNMDGKKTLTVNLPEPGSDETVTRSSMYGQGNARIFNAEDKLRAYDENLQKYDEYTYAEGNVFVTEGKAVETPTYTLFPAEMVEYGSWKPEVGLYALVHLGGEDGHLSYGEEAVPQANGTQALAYLSNIPEFGVVDNTKEQLSADPVFLTGILKVKIENGAGNVKAIRVRSLTADNNPNTEMPLWGDFDAILDNENGMSVEENLSRLAVSTESRATKPAEANATLIVDIDAAQMKNYTSYIYIPIIPTVTKAEAKADASGEVTYPKLVVEYLKVTEDNKDWGDDSAVETVTEFTNKQIKTNTVYSKDADGEAMVIDGFNLESSPKNLKELNEDIEYFNGIDANGELTINVDLGTTGLSVPAQDNNVIVPEAKKLQLPTLSRDMVLNITNGSFTDNTLYIEDKGTAGTGKLTIKLSGDENTCTKVVSTSAHAIVLEGKTDDNTFAGVEIDNANSDFTMNAKSTAGITLTAAKSLTLGVDPGQKIEAKAVNVTIDKELAAYASEIETTTGSVTVDGTTMGKITTASGDVTVNGSASEVVTTSGKVTIKGFEAVEGTAATPASAGSIATLTTGGDVEIELPIEGVAITTKLVANNANDGQTITLNQGYIKELDATTAKKVTVKHDAEKEGLTAVGTLTANSNATFNKSTWNGEKIGGTFSGDYANTNVYTASQLATKITKGGGVVLYSDVDMADIAWTATGTLGGNFNGKKHTISNLNLTSSNGLYSAANANEKAVSDLTIDGVTIANEAKATKIGAFVGTVNANNAVTFSNVKVQGIKSAEGSNVERTVIGGLIGYVSADAEVTLKGVSTAGSISGYHSLGGFIGQADGKVTIDNASASTVTFDRAYKSTEQNDIDYLRIGKFIGTIAKDIDVTITTAEGADITTPLTIGNSAGFTGTMQKVYVTGDSKTTNYDVVFGQNLIGYSAFENETKATINEAEYGVSETKPASSDKNKYLYYVDRTAE